MFNLKDYVKSQAITSALENVMQNWKSHLQHWNESSTTIAISVHDSKIHGEGVFCEEKEGVCSDSMIGFFLGEMKLASEFENRCPNQYCVYFAFKDLKVVVNSEKQGKLKL